eukprot:2584051-Prorocentrum_lima.AAC.1
MTSSLVGSEMCIRDRGATMPRAASLAAYCMSGLSRAKKFNRITQDLKTCLLYTSDAADDM